MLTLTENARHAVEDLAERAGLPEAGGLRIAEADTPGSFELSLVAEPADGDDVIDTGAARVYVAAATVEVLADHQLDATPSAEGTGFLLAPQGAESVVGAENALGAESVVDDEDVAGVEHVENVENVENPAQDAESPVWEAGTPAWDAGSPVWESGTPAWGVERPAWNTDGAEWPERAWNAESPQDPEGPGGSDELF